MEKFTGKNFMIKQSIYLSIGKKMDRVCKKYAEQCQSLLVQQYGAISENIDYEGFFYCSLGRLSHFEWNNVENEVKLNLYRKKARYLGMPEGYRGKYVDDETRKINLMEFHRIVGLTATEMVYLNGKTHTGEIL